MSVYQQKFFSMDNNNAIMQIFIYMCVLLLGEYFSFFSLFLVVVFFSFFLCWQYNQQGTIWTNGQIYVVGVGKQSIFYQRYPGCVE
jgi:hypothetical protein